VSDEIDILEEDPVEEFSEAVKWFRRNFGRKLTKSFHQIPISGAPNVSAWAYIGKCPFPIADGSGETENDALKVLNNKLDDLIWVLIDLHEYGYVKVIKREKPQSKGGRDG
jgi:hypothetical protein